MRTAIWLLLPQASLSAFDTLYYHEYKLKLPLGDHTGLELRLHAARDFAYAIIIGTLLGFVTWTGVCAWFLLALLAGGSASRSGFHRGGQDPRLPPESARCASWASSTARSSRS